MYPPERQERHRRVCCAMTSGRGIAQISEQLGVTTETVRRISTCSSGEGCYGGCEAAPSCCTRRRSSKALAARHAKQFEDKVAIARRVVAELPEDGVVILDSGSLTFVCAQVMPTDRRWSW